MRMRCGWMVLGEDLHSEECVFVFSVMAFYTKVRFTACIHAWDERLREKEENKKAQHSEWGGTVTVSAPIGSVVDTCSATGIIHPTHLSFFFFSPFPFSPSLNHSN